MNYIIYVLIGFLAALVALAIWVRLAPTNAAQWHNPKLPVMEPGEYPSVNGHLVQRSLEGDGMADFAALDRIIRDSPRTKVIAGSVADGRVTYCTRTPAMGFPDFTTVTLTQNQATGMATLQVYGRLRFGRSDLGVNKARIRGWLAQLDADAGADRPAI